MKTAMVLMALVGLLSACATVEGVGRDISGGAQRVNDWIN
jgi:predicted small secreted protein